MKVAPLPNRLITTGTIAIKRNFQSQRSKTFSMAQLRRLMELIDALHAATDELTLGRPVLGFV